MKCSLPAFPAIDALPIVLIILTGIVALVVWALKINVKIIGMELWTFILTVGSYITLFTWALIKTVQRTKIRNKYCAERPMVTPLRYPMRETIESSQREQSSHDATFESTEEYPARDAVFEPESVELTKLPSRGSPFLRQVRGL